MPAELTRLTSFNLDLDDWYSCHTSDDEAYQDALERNSVFSFCTARGGASTAATGMAIGSPSRLADADQALAEMVIDPVDDPRIHHEPPELDEEDAPVFKRTRSVCVAPLPSAFSPTPTIATPSNKARLVVRAFSRRGQLFRGSAVAASPAAMSAKALRHTMSAAGPVRIRISLQPDRSSVRLQVLPSIFCFGDVPLPVSATNYPVVPLGPEAPLPVDSSFLDKAEPDCLQSSAFEPEDPITTEAGSMVKFEADCSVKLVTRPRGTTPCKADTPKDLMKEKRQADDKFRKSTGGIFSGSFLRIFTGMRPRRVGDGRKDIGSSCQGPLPPVTVRELGSELLMASAAMAAVDLAAAAEAIPVVAGYVQAAPPAAVAAVAAAPPTNPGDAALEPAMLDEAAIAVRRLSEDIFRNVLLSTANGTDVASTPKAILSPRNAAFPPAEPRPLSCDPTPSAPEPAVDADGNVQGADIGETERAPDGSQQAPLPSVGDGSDGTKLKGQEPDTGVVVATEAEAAGLVAVAEKDQLAMVRSVEVLDCGEMPMPALEQCESPPVAVGDATDAESDANEDAYDNELEGLEGNGDTGEASAGETGVVTPVKSVLAGTEASADASASPRTASKRAYGTVARLVKKMAPSFRDTSLMSLSTSTSAQTSTVAVTESAAKPKQGQLPAEDEVAAAMATAPLTGGGDVSAEPVAAKVLVGEPSSGSASSETAEECEGAELGHPADKIEPADVAAPVAENSSGPPTPVLFVFGQEQAKVAKHGPGKTRSLNPKSVTAAPFTSDDMATPTEAAGRKRRGGDEILPSAKVPVVAERTSSNASQDGLAPAEPPTAEDTVTSAEPMADESETAPPATVTQDPVPIPPEEAEVTRNQATMQGFNGVVETPSQGPAAVITIVTESKGAPARRTDGDFAEQGQVMPTSPTILGESVESPLLATPLAAPLAEEGSNIVSASSVAPEAIPAECGLVAVDVPATAVKHDESTLRDSQNNAALPMEKAEDEPVRADCEAAPAVITATTAQVDAHHSPGAVQEHEELQAGTVGSTTVLAEVPREDPGSTSKVTMALQPNVDIVAPISGGPGEEGPQEAAPALLNAQVAMQHSENRDAEASEASKETIERNKEIEVNPLQAPMSPVEVPPAGGDATQEQATEAQSPTSPCADKPPEGGKQKRRSSGFGSFFGCFRS